MITTGIAIAAGIYTYIWCRSEMGTVSDGIIVGLIVAVIVKGVLGLII